MKYIVSIGNIFSFHEFVFTLFFCEGYTFDDASSLQNPPETP